MKTSQTIGANASDQGRARLRAAFTLIELLVVISIIGVLVAMLIPALGKARESARKVKCAANERATMQGGAVYTLDFKGRLPDRGGNGTYPTYGDFGASIGMVSADGVWELGNYIYTSPVWRGAGKRASYTAFCLDYLNQRGNMTITLDGSGNDSWIGFNTLNTPLHCPSTRIDGEGGAYYHSPKSFMSYMLNGFATFNNYYAVAQDQPAGFPVLDRVTDFTNVPGGNTARIPMVVDVANHEDGGNVAHFDGSVKGFSTADSYLLTAGSGRSCYIPKGYVILTCSGHDYYGGAGLTGDEFRSYSMSQCYYYHPDTGVFVADIGTALSTQHIQCFGYTSNGQ
jgi:prepilin-type N-terminal cleavage/methylation domain-containing protein/prepilin-type processing-associated H-X9-DG protein